MHFFDLALCSSKMAFQNEIEKYDEDDEVRGRSGGCRHFILEQSEAETKSRFQLGGLRKMKLKRRVCCVDSIYIGEETRRHSYLRTGRMGVSG